MARAALTAVTGVMVTEGWWTRLGPADGVDIAEVREAHSRKLAADAAFRRRHALLGDDPGVAELPASLSSPLASAAVGSVVSSPPSLSLFDSQCFPVVNFFFRFFFGFNNSPRLWIRFIYLLMINY